MRMVVLTISISVIHFRCVSDEASRPGRNALKLTVMLSTQLIDSYETEGYSNRPLSQIEICKILDEHGISWEYNSEKVLFAVDRGIDEYTNTTNWQLFDLLAFLNY